MVSIDTAIKEYESELVDRTLCFLLGDKKVLLGYKKTGFGKGNIVGIGGGVEIGELPTEAAIREVEEEVFITPLDLKFTGVFDFYFPYVEKPISWNQRVFVYTSTSWSGSVAESDEIAPEWHSINELPFHKMWDDNKYWLEDILRGEEIWAQFTFNLDLKVENWKKRELSTNQELTNLGCRLSSTKLNTNSNSTFS